MQEHSSDLCVCTELGMLTGTAQNSRVQFPARASGGARPLAEERGAYLRKENSGQIFSKATDEADHATTLLHDIA